jgi:hypothetical protein
MVRRNTEGLFLLAHFLLEHFLMEQCPPRAAMQSKILTVF